MGELIGTIQTEAERKGYFVMLIGGEKIEDVVDMASRWNVEGLIILGYDEERYRQLSKKTEQKDDIDRCISGRGIHLPECRS